VFDLRKKKKRSPDTMGKYASLSQIASLFEVDPRTVNRWSDPKDKIHIEGFEKVGHGQYDLRKCVHAWKHDMERRISEAQSGFKSAKEFNLKLDAQKKELELAELNKDLIRVDEAVTFLDKIINLLKNSLPSKRKTIMPKLLIAKDDKAALKILEARDTDLLNEISISIEDIIRGLAESTNKNYSAARTDKAKRRRTS
jgi:signal recognition particle GTPase